MKIISERYSMTRRREIRPDDLFSAYYGLNRETATTIFVGFGQRLCEEYAPKNIIRIEGIMHMRLWTLGMGLIIKENYESNRTKTSYAKINIYKSKIWTCWRNRRRRVFKYTNETAWGFRRYLTWINRRATITFTVICIYYMNTFDHFHTNSFRSLINVL